MELFVNRSFVGPVLAIDRAKAHTASLGGAAAAIVCVFVALKAKRRFLLNSIEECSSRRKMVNP